MMYLYINVIGFSIIIALLAYLYITRHMDSQLTQPEARDRMITLGRPTKVPKLSLKEASSQMLHEVGDVLVHGRTISDGDYQGLNDAFYVLSDALKRAR